jgi:hypothetical protein
MTVSWNDQYNPDELAQYIEQCKKVDESGRIHFEGFRFMEYQVVLYSMLDFPDTVPEIEGRRIAQRAIVQAGKSGTITRKSLIAEASKLTQEYLKRSTERYVLVTTLSLLPSVALPTVRIDNTYVIFEPYHPLRYQKGRLQLVESARHSLFAEPPTEYLSVRVHVSARSPYEGADKATDILDLVRGIWNWFYNRPRWIRSSSGRRSPINKVILGPLHTLHHLTGRLATETWWYQPEYLGAVPSFNPLPEDIEGMYKFLDNVRDRLAKCSYRESVEQGIIRYTRALDLRDWEAAFLKLWSVLELLTNSCFDNNIMTAKRTASVYEDREYAWQVLKHLREYRNRSVHADVGNAAIETYMYQLKNFVEGLLDFHLGKSRRFESLQEAARFLDLPTDKAALETRARLIEYARKFRGYT